MERLTLREANGCVLPGFENNGVNGCYDIPDAEWLEESIDRLAAIEDILGDDYDLDRLRELVEAGRDERVVVLPCKIGENVYSAIPAYGGVNKHQIRKFEINKEGEFACSALMIPFSFFGKSVFLTREAAEEAMKGEQNGKDY